MICAGMRRIFHFFTVCFFSQVSAAAQFNACPPQIIVDQTTVAPPGWTAFDDADGKKHRFLSVDFSDGPPESRNTLAPNRQLKRNGNPVNVFIFPSDSQMQPWIQCAYSGTTMTLSQRLPTGTKKCEVEYDRNFKEAVAKSVDCE